MQMQIAIPCFARDDKTDRAGVLTVHAIWPRGLQLI